MAEGEVGCSCDADSAGNPALAGLLGLGFMIAARRRRR
jgi:MYXO-CTERM domain-containing protein